MESTKYPRSLHSHISLGTTSDDRFIPAGYVEVFSGFEKLILTEKLDGQNDCLNQYGVFARSHAAPTAHPWDNPIWEKWHLIKNDLGDIEIFGENMFAIHSIAYQKLESYFYVFGVREKGTWLSWEEVKFFAEMFDFPTVPEIKVEAPLKSFTGHRNENDQFRTWLNYTLGMDWEDYVETPGQLGGYDPHTFQSCCEGFVIRNANEYKVNAGHLPVEENEFDSLLKLVRRKHVKTDLHWTKNWKPAPLSNYSKYHWEGYQYISKK